MEFDFLLRPEDPDWRALGLLPPVIEKPAPCPYLEDRLASERSVFSRFRLPPDLYQSLMNRGWRRSGPIVYQTSCADCQECRPIRVPVGRFVPNRTQRRLIRRNASLVDKVCRPIPTDENFELFCRYQTARHRGDMCTRRDQYDMVLFTSCVNTVLVEFREEGRLAGVSLVDIGPGWGSAVYSWFDPDLQDRSMGTWMILWALTRLAPQFRMDHYYLGLYIRDCRKMNYKSNFRPCEIGNAEGEWECLE